MLREIAGLFYKLGRQSGKAASTLNDIDVLLSGDPKRIAKRFARKEINKIGNKITRDISRKIK
jgi:hypothetical protein